MKDKVREVQPRKARVIMFPPSPDGESVRILWWPKPGEAASPIDVKRRPFEGEDAMLLRARLVATVLKSAPQ